MGLNLASSFTLVWPFLWSVQTLKEPCISSFPRSLRFPWNAGHMLGHERQVNLGRMGFWGTLEKLHARRGKSQEVAKDQPAAGIGREEA